MERKEIKETLEELRDEFDAQPAWAAHESAVVYLEHFHAKIKEVMTVLEIHPAKHETSANTAREGEDTSDFEAFMAFMALDDAFYKEMEKAYHLISEKI